MAPLDLGRSTELRIRVFFTLEGEPHQAVIHSTRPMGDIMAVRGKLRQAVEAYFSVIGGEVDSVQLEIVGKDESKGDALAPVRVGQVLAFPSAPGTAERLDQNRQRALTGTKESDAG